MPIELNEAILLAAAMLDRLSFACSCVFLVATGCTRHAHIISWQEYSSRSHTWPYVVNIQTPKKHLLYFGSSHTKDPTDPQILDIERMWSEFGPDEAFNEGGNPPTEKTKEQAVNRWGEPGFIRFLAQRDKVPVQSIDPTQAAEVADLRKKFPPEKVKFFFVLRTVSEYRRVYQGSTKTLDEELERVLPIYAAVPGLDVAPKSILELESMYAQYFPNQGSFRDVRPSWFDPTTSETFLNDISRRSGLYRDQYMVGLLIKEVRRGKRVFAVVGGSHVVRQEPALRSILR